MRKRKDELVKVRVTVGEKQGFQRAAESAGIALSAWIRERLREIAKRELRKDGHRVPF